MLGDVLYQHEPCEITVAEIGLILVSQQHGLFQPRFQGPLLSGNWRMSDTVNEVAVAQQHALLALDFRRFSNVMIRLVCCEKSGKMRIELE